MAFRTLFVSGFQMVFGPLAAILLKPFENRTFVSGLAASLDRFGMNKIFVINKTV
jgi:hypothetical protein